MIKKLSIVLLVVFAVQTFPTTATAKPTFVTSSVTYALPFYRTELYFGRSIPGGGSVSDEDWENFLLTVVTPRFPEGFTVLKGRGQWQQRDGAVIKEPTEILVILYPKAKRLLANRRIEAIRRAYIKRFKQNSVLRVDYPGIVNVTF
jgi:hypothetical protein